MAGIFISYRRSDSQGEAGRLFDDLSPLFGEHAVFMDVSAIEAGRDFRKAIEEGVTRCGVLLVIMGPEWLTAKDEAGASRLGNPADFVRLETASALKRDIPVIPVLVRGARMPSAEQLPDDLKELAYRNCVELTHARWKSDLELLVEALHRLLPATEAAPPAAKEPAKPAAASQIEAAVLQRVSRELALHIGPVAEIVVRRAAPGCACVEDLYVKVSEEIDSSEERRGFLAGCASLTSYASAESSVTLPADLSKHAGTLPHGEKVAAKPGRGKYFLLLAAVGLLAGLALAMHFTPSKNRDPAKSPAAATQIQSPEPKQPPPTPIKMDKISAEPASTSAATLFPAKPVANPAAAIPVSASSPLPDSPPSSPRVAISTDAAQALLISKVLPKYPQLALQAHIQGEVILDALISKDGAIESLKEVSGHPLLVPAAIDAARQFHYKPYLLHGKPAPVSTQIDVRFTLLGN